MHLREFLMTYELYGTSTDAKVLQRLKILSALSHNHVNFKVLDPENGIVLVYTREDNFPSDIYVNKISLDRIMQVRSAVLQLNDISFVVLDYSIPRVNDVSNDAFLKKMQGSDINSEEVSLKKNNAFVSYEGSVLVCNKVNGSWCIRTNACDNAFTSHYNHEMSHGLQFAKTCEYNNYGGEYEWQEVLNKLAEKLPNAYYVFVLVTPAQRYLCDYSGALGSLPNQLQNKECDLFLVEARDTSTHAALDLSQQDIISVEQPVEYTTVLKNLDEERVFKNKPLSLQGYVIRTAEGELYRTYTNAYREGMQTIPHHDNPFYSALQCYMKRSLTELCEIKNMDEPSSETLKKSCATTFNSICNLIAYVFIVFTEFHVAEEIRTTETGDEKYYEKSFTKRNKALYDSMKSQAPTKHQKLVVDAFFNMLAKIQGVAKNGKHGFINREYLISDIGNVLRFQANKTLDFKRFMTLILGYNEFVVYFNMMIDRYNHMLRDQFIEYKKTNKTRQEKPFQLNNFKNKLDEELATVFATSFKHHNPPNF